MKGGDVLSCLLLKFQRCFRIKIMKVSVSKRWPFIKLVVLLLLSVTHHFFTIHLSIRHTFYHVRLVFDHALKLTRQYLPVAVSMLINPSLSF